MRLALFDLDHTLLDGDTDELWGRFLGEEGLLAEREWSRERARHEADYRNGTLDIEAFRPSGTAVIYVTSVREDEESCGTGGASAQSGSCEIVIGGDPSGDPDCNPGGGGGGGTGPQSRKLFLTVIDTMRPSFENASLFPSDLTNPIELSCVDLPHPGPASEIGMALSKDPLDRKLYVAVPDQNHVRVYDLNSDGSVNLGSTTTIAAGWRPTDVVVSVANDGLERALITRRGKAGGGVTNQEKPGLLVVFSDGTIERDITIDDLSAIPVSVSANPSPTGQLMGIVADSGRNKIIVFNTVTGEIGRELATEDIPTRVVVQGQ